MYVGIDVGGTKTLVAVLDDRGVILESRKFPTPKKYANWLLELRHAQAHLEHQDLKSGGVAIPGRVDRHHGRGISFGNLSWQNVPVQADCEKVFNCPIVVENDANLAALSEAMVHKKYNKVLYITISTGIGTGFIADQHIVPSMADSEGGHIMLPYKDKLAEWEDFASGRAIFEQYKMKAVDINDEKTWRAISRNLALGFFEHIALLQPDVIIIGGSVGTHFKKYKTYLEEELHKFEVPIVPIPPIVQAKRPEEAVVYGCYDLAKATFNHAKTS